MPDWADNSKFTFDPREVVDNSPQDQDPGIGAVLTLFRITAPNETGLHSIMFSYRDYRSEILITVVGSASASYAAIAGVSSPMVSKTGETVRVNVTLQNNGTEPSTFYVYATNSSAEQVVFAKVYSQAPVERNETTMLSAEFMMPNGSLVMTIYSGHVESGGEIDDGRFTVYLFQSVLAPPVQKVSFSALAVGWTPWMAILGASLGSVLLVGVYARRGRRLLPKGGKLKFALVQCAGCTVCKNAIKGLGKGALPLASHGVNLTPNLASAGEDGHVDVAFVVGSIRTEKDLQAVEQARENAKLLVAFGACSSFGSMAASDRRRVDMIARGLRKPSSLEEELGQRTIETTPLSDHVKVDLTIPGCPPPIEAIRHVIQYGSSSGEGNRKLNWKPRKRRKESRETHLNKQVGDDNKIVALSQSPGISLFPIGNALLLAQSHSGP
jgi:coenzyme F420-reducing hydrogenase gamma subunit